MLCVLCPPDQLAWCRPCPAARTTKRALRLQRAHPFLPICLPLPRSAVLCCLEAFADVPAVTTPLLKFVSEFVFNKSQRLTFDSSSPNGILLFREV